MRSEIIRLRGDSRPIVEPQHLMARLYITLHLGSEQDVFKVHTSVIPPDQAVNEAQETIMSATDTNATPAEAPAVTQPRRKWLNGRRFGLAAVLAGITALGAGAVYSQQPYGYGQGYGPGPGYGPPIHGGMMGHGSMFGFGPERMFDFALSSVGATSEQKLKIVTIAQSAMQDLRPLRDRRYAASLKLAILLKADAVDRAAIEKLRAEEFAAFEAGSKRAAQALSEAAEVLTPTQRQQLVERWENRRRHWRG
jgi:periplasmic protein CpxP/Spy